MIDALVYVSAAVRPFSQADLAELLAQARVNNHRDGITGMLLHHDGSFMQAIEGPPAALDALVERLRADPRHGRLIVLLRQSHLRREFADWAMACFHGADLPPGEREQVVDFFGEAHAPECRAAAVGRARLLLNGFRDALIR